MQWQLELIDSAQSEMLLLFTISRRYICKLMDLFGVRITLIFVPLIQFSPNLIDYSGSVWVDSTVYRGCNNSRGK